MSLFGSVNDCLISRYSEAVQWAKRHVESRTLDAWEYKSLPRVLRNVATAGVALAISCPALYWRSNLSIPQLALTIVGAAALAPRLGAFVASKAANLFRKSFKPAYVAKEIQKVAELSKSNSKSVLILQSSHDPEAAFTTHLFVDSFKKWAASHCIDVIKEVSSVEIHKALAQIDRNKRYDAIVFSAHASPDGIILAENMMISKDYLALRTFTKSIKKHLIDGGSIIIKGCSAGAGDNNIVREISRRVPDAMVYASSDEVEEYNIEYKDDMTPRFFSYSTNWGFNKSREDTTRIYRNGELYTGSQRDRKSNGPFIDAL